MKFFWQAMKRSTHIDAKAASLAEAEVLIQKAERSSYLFLHAQACGFYSKAVRLLERFGNYDDADFKARLADLYESGSSSAFTVFRRWNRTRAKDRDRALLWQVQGLNWAKKAMALMQELIDDQPTAEAIWDQSVRLRNLATELSRGGFFQEARIARKREASVQLAWAQFVMDNLDESTRMTAEYHGARALLSLDQLIRSMDEAR